MKLSKIFSLIFHIFIQVSFQVKDKYLIEINKNKEFIEKNRNHHFTPNVKFRKNPTFKTSKLVSQILNRQSKPIDMSDEKINDSKIIPPIQESNDLQKDINSDSFVNFTDDEILGSFINEENDIDILNHSKQTELQVQNVTKRVVLVTLRNCEAYRNMLQMRQV